MSFFLLYAVVSRLPLGIGLDFFLAFLPFTIRWFHYGRYLLHCVHFFAFIFSSFGKKKYLIILMRNFDKYLYFSRVSLTLQKLQILVESLSNITVCITISFC